MTVAIAAICQFAGAPLIIAAEDHMITSRDVQFEQPQAKMVQLNLSSVAMLFGDGEAQSKVAIAARDAVRADKLELISDIATRYRSLLTRHVLQLAEAEVLNPLGLTVSQFLRQQSSMNSDLVQQLSKQLQDYYIESGLYRTLGGALIAGADASGGQVHIYRVEFGIARFVDHIGFVAAGSGERHAESELMFSRYTQYLGFPKALSIVFSAKKRAEVAPGVGSETDIVLITSSSPALYHYQSESPLVKSLDRIYSQAIAKHKKADAWRDTQIDNIFAKMLKDAPAENPRPPEETKPAASPSGVVVEPEQPAPTDKEKKLDPPTK